MSEQKMTEQSEVKAPLVIACGDEGVQINTGCRFAFLGAGFQLLGFHEAIQALKKVLANYPTTDTQLRIVANEENAYFRESMHLNDWDEANASMQQRIAALADKEALLYAGILPFSDPVELEHEVKGHMVRPHDVHIANKICFTLAGGESTYNLGQYLISADWLLQAKDQALAKETLQTQVDFYCRLAKKAQLPMVLQMEGPLGEAVAAENLKLLSAMGFAVSK
jgi:hypothetical protein